MNFLKKYNLYEIIFFVVFVFFMFYKLIVCFPLMGSFMIFKVIDYFLFLKYIKKNGVLHNGEIVSYENDRGYKTPVIAFETSEQHIKQRPRLYVSSDLDKFRSYKKNIGKTVSLLYDPRNPEKFILVNKGESIYFGLILVFLVGVAFIIVGLGALL